MTNRYILSAFLFSFTLATHTLHANPPALMNYQGRLVNGSNLVNQTIALQLRLFDALTDGSLLYEDSNTVTVVDGLYSTYIGDNTSYGSLTNALTNSSVYVEVVIDGQALSPRDRLVSVAYALNGVQGPQGIPGPIDTWSSNQVVTLNSYTNETVWRDGRMLWTGTDNHGGYVITNTTLYGDVVAQTAAVASLQADTFLLATTVWDDVVSPLLVTPKNTSTFKPPVWKKMAGITGELYQYAFEHVTTEANVQESMFSVQMPHSYKRGTALYPHLHFIPADTNATGVAVWGIEFAAGPLTGVFASASTTYYMTNTIPSSTNIQMIIQGWQAIPGTGLKESSCIFGRIFRSSSVRGDTYPGDLFGISFDLHFERDSLGSKDQIPR